MPFFLSACARALLVGALLPIASISAAPTSTASHAPSPTSANSAPRVPALLAVRKELGPPPAGVTDLKFRDVFKLPVGAKGLEPTEKLLSLDGKRVRIVGFMVQQEAAPIGAFLLSPLPSMLGDEDESLADDLPASAIRVELTKARDLRVPALPGLLQLTGTLHVGMRADASGRSTPAQLTLDAAPERELRSVARAVSKQARKPN